MDVEYDREKEYGKKSGLVGETMKVDKNIRKQAQVKESNGEGQRESILCTTLLEATY